MKKVEKMSIALLDYEIKVTYNLNEEPEDNITQDMRKFWNEEENKIVNLLKKSNFVDEKSTLKFDDNIILINSHDISICTGINIVKLLEDNGYEICTFQFDSEYDDFYEEEPSLFISIKINNY